ncbi:MAG: CPBP family intramembrane glutamic endopeptidase [Bacilli bacterium]
MKNIKNVLFSTLIVMLYFSWIILIQFNFNSDVSLKTNCTSLFLISVLFLCLFVLLFHKQLRNDCLQFFKEKYFQKVIMYFVFIISIFLIMTGILQMFGLSYYNNLSIIFKSFPGLILFNILVFTPVVEEIVFRGAFRKAISQKKLFIITSGVIYGLLHAIILTQSFNALLMIIPFIALGLILSYIYVKYENLVVNIFVSFLFNISFLMILVI